MEITHTSFETCLERLTNHNVNDSRIVQNDNFHWEINRKEGILFALSLLFITLTLFLTNLALLFILLIINSI